MATQRYNFFKQVHKGVRVVVHGVVEQAQRTDFAQPAEVAGLQGAVENAFSIFEEHAAKEIEFITPVLRTCAPHLAADSDAEHHEQELRLRDLRRALAEAARTAGGGHAFVVALSRFEGEMLVHMADEEERVMPALWAAFDDGALRRVHQALLASIPPGDMVQTMAWMLPALSQPERAELLVGARAGAPPEAFAALAGIASRVLPASDWSRLEQALTAAA